MEQASNDPFSKKYKKYNLHDKEKLGKLCAFFLSVLLLCSVLLLVYLDFATIILLSTIIRNLRVITAKERITKLHAVLKQKKFRHFKRHSVYYVNLLIYIFRL